MDLRAVHPVQPEVLVGCERLWLGVEPSAQECGEFGEALAANVTHSDKHGILHRGIVNGTTIPDTSVD
jgi:hypothetical protein